MTNEERILERLEAMEQQINDLHRRAEAKSYFIDQLTPIGSQAFRLMVRELETLNGRVDLDDIFDLVRNLLRAVPTLNGLIGQVQSFADLWNIIQPAFAPTFPHIIAAMGQWEQNGVFTKLSALKEAGGTLLDSQTPEQIAQLGKTMAFLLDLLVLLNNPQTQHTLQSLLGALSTANIEGAKPVSIFGMLGAINTAEAKNGLGVLVEILKAVGTKPAV